MACEGTSCVLIHQQQTVCTLCGKNVKDCGNNKESQKNYQKLVDPPAAEDSDEECPFSFDPIPHPKPPFSTPIPPLITYTPTIEYRVTSEVRGKPGNVPGVQYIMNHYAMDRSDVEQWIEKKKRMAERNESWVGDGTYIETHPNALHSYGLTTHLFLKNPDKPYGNSPRLPPVCGPRNGL